MFVLWEISVFVFVDKVSYGKIFENVGKNVATKLENVLKRVGDDCM